MPSLQAIVGKRCPVTFDWHGEAIEIAYRPYSERIENEVKGDADWNTESMKGLIRRVVIDWNLTDGDAMAPVSEETLADLPVELIFAIFFACQNDLRNPTLPTVSTVSG
jgi:hypothetical protein